MKIAIASDDEITITPSFERTKGFVIANLKNGRITAWEYRENDFTDHRREHTDNDHDSGKYDPILTALKDCNIVIAHGMGRRFFSELKVSGIETYFTEEIYVARAINLYVAGILDNNPDLGTTTASSISY